MKSGVSHHVALVPEFSVPRAWTFGLYIGKRKRKEGPVERVLVIATEDVSAAYVFCFLAVQTCSSWSRAVQTCSSWSMEASGRYGLGFYVFYEMLWGTPNLADEQSPDMCWRRHSLINPCVDALSNLRVSRRCL